MNKIFKGKTVLITGGKGDIGSSLVRTFNSLGANIITTTTSLSGLKQKNQTIKYYHLDFLKLETLYKFIEEINKIKVDILVNNAGVNYVDSILNIKDNKITDLLNINLKSQILLTKYVVKKMITNKIKGKIINISSIWGNISREKRSIYSASKHGINGFTKGISLDLAKHKIIVNSVSPGFIMTKLTKKTNTKKDLKDILKSIPLQKFGSVKDVSNLVTFLASSENTYITGQNLIIDGGYSIK